MTEKENLTLKVAQRIRQLRISHNLTQENIAEVLKISASNYAKVERGEIDITLKRLEQLAYIYGISPADMLNENAPLSIKTKNNHYTLIGNNQGASVQFYTSPQDQIYHLNQTLQHIIERLEIIEEKIKP